MARFVWSGINPAPFRCQDMAPQLPDTSYGTPPGRNTEKIERPPAMQYALAWCKRGYKNQMIKLAAYHFQGIAGRSNVQLRTSNMDGAALYLF